MFPRVFNELAMSVSPSVWKSDYYKMYMAAISLFITGIETFKGKLREFEIEVHKAIQTLECLRKPIFLVDS